MNIESKIKVVRFIGELVKFRMYSKIEGLYCLKILVQDFTHHHIEMCCNMLEACGRFFFRHPDCYQRIKVYMVSTGNNILRVFNNFFSIFYGPVLGLIPAVLY